MLGPFHEAIVYVDESGDHGPVSQDYPVFVLAFCIFDKSDYAENTTTRVQRFKFKYFGHDALVLHERDIRKEQPPFDILRRPGVRDAFYEDLNRLIEETQFTLVAAAIRKDKIGGSVDVYSLAMEFGLERIALHFNLKPNDPKLHVVCESRGKREDDEMELAFRRICAGSNFRNLVLPCDLVFARKERSHAGMEFADLIARPIGRHVLQPQQANRAWDILEKKFRRGPNGGARGWGLKVFP